MGLTITQEGRNNVSGSRQTVTLKVVPDASWLAVGEDLTLTDWVKTIETVSLDGGATGYVWQYDRANNKLLAYEAGADGAGLDAVADATDLSTHTVYISVTGRRA